MSIQYNNLCLYDKIVSLGNTIGNLTNSGKLLASAKRVYDLNKSC